MSRESLVLVIGFLMLFVPWLGVPEEWRFYVITICGVILVIAGYLLRRAAYLRRIDMGGGERGTDSFVESSVATVNGHEDFDELPEERDE